MPHIQNQMAGNHALIDRVKLMHNIHYRANYLLNNNETPDWYCRQHVEPMIALELDNTTDMVANFQNLTL